MEKASSLSEAEENLDPITSGGSHSGVRGEVMHPRSLKPVESGVFSGGSVSGVSVSGVSGPGGSGPVSGEQLVESLQSALSAASRGEAGLGSLHRSVRDASRALTASRHAHESLTEELRVMYRGLNEVMSEKAAIERYAALLTQERDAALDAAEEARREAKREREFLLREQDRFIQLLLEEHEAELQQARRGVAFPQAPHSTLASTTSPGIAPAVPPARSSGVAPFSPAIEPSVVRSVDERRVDERKVVERQGDEGKNAPPATAEEDDADEITSPRVSGSALARLALATTSSDRQKQVSLPSNARENPDKSLLETQRSEAPPVASEDKSDERAPTYPPPPAVLDLDALAAEVDGNSERPPPIRRLGTVEPALHLKPARVPSLLDTLVSQTGVSNTEGSNTEDLEQTSRKS